MVTIQKTKDNKMNKTQMTQLLDAVTLKITDDGWNDFKLVPHANPEELRRPDAPTWDSTGESFYNVHAWYATHRDAYTNKGGRVKMKSDERYAYFIVKYKTDDGIDIKKINSVEIDGSIIHISTEIIVGGSSHLGTYQQEVDMTFDKWDLRFAYAITTGRR